MPCIENLNTRGSESVIFQFVLKFVNCSAASPWISQGVAYNPNDNSPVHSRAQQPKSMEKHCRNLKFTWKEFHSKRLYNFRKMFGKATQVWDWSESILLCFQNKQIVFNDSHDRQSARHSGSASISRGISFLLKKKVCGGTFDHNTLRT